MKFGPIPIDQAEGKILGHHIAAPDGRRAFRKGKPLAAEDIVRLRELGRTTVYAAELEADDIDENEASQRVAAAVAGSGVWASSPSVGRVNLNAAVHGLLRVDAQRLARINTPYGITLATLASHIAVQPDQLIASIKVIPFAIAEATIRTAEAIASENGAMIRIDALQTQDVSLILSGSSSARERIVNSFEPPLHARIDALGSTIKTVDFIPLEDEAGEIAMADALHRHVNAGSKLIILAGETAIMDRHDIAPRAVERAGGQIECVGAPVDPGNLLMLAYLDDIPILGAPGCARSPKTNIIDWVLPRLLVGDTLSQIDIVALGHGGLLEDIPERPIPRSKRTKATKST